MRYGKQKMKKKCEHHELAVEYQDISYANDEECSIWFQDVCILCGEKVGSKYCLSFRRK